MDGEKNKEKIANFYVGGITHDKKRKIAGYQQTARKQEHLLVFLFWPRCLKNLS